MLLTRQVRKNGFWACLKKLCDKFPFQIKTVVAHFFCFVGLFNLSQEPTSCVLTVAQDFIWQKKNTFSSKTTMLIKNIHPLFATCFRVGSWKQQLIREAQTSFFTATSSSTSSMSWVFPRTVGHVWNTSLMRCHGGNRTRWPNHLNSLFSMWRSSSATPSLCRLTKFLNLFIRESPASMQRHFGHLYQRSCSFSHYQNFWP